MVCQHVFIIPHLNTVSHSGALCSLCELRALYCC
ncbi:rCG29052 [Rattus norvegicus]|uniref:RCG29052 n=1 Tax=Rattus norvegicus TaxID=10116 RepID=A6HW29_RAT|nr:rCG29052 [Rattus norvegicus]